MGWWSSARPINPWVDGVMHGNSWVGGVLCGQLNHGLVEFCTANNSMGWWSFTQPNKNGLVEFCTAN
jgi:hypothetical protein